MNGGFSAKVDWFSLAGTNMAITGSSDGRSNQVAEAVDANGDVTKRDVYLDKISPSANYVLKAAMTALAALGTVTSATYGGQTKKVMITQIVVSTSQSAIPTIAASGVEVEHTAKTGRTYGCGTIDLKCRSRAQDILKILTATNADLNSATFTFSITPVIGETATDGVVASDSCKGQVSASYSFVQTGSVDATFTAASGCDITAVPASTRNDGSYIEWSVTVTKDLVGTDTPSAT